MKVLANKMNRWRLSLDHGDIKKISETSGYSRYHVRNAIKKGEAILEVIRAVDAFVEAKRELIK